MFKLIIKAVVFLIVFTILFVLLVFCIPEQYNDSYQRVLSIQYDSYNQIQGKKITAIGGSSLCYGFDIYQMEQLSGMPTQILGMHGSIGLPYLIQISKANINDGDIIIIELMKNDMEMFGEKLVITGVENNFEMYRYLLPNQVKQLIRIIPEYVSDKLGYWLNPFDASGEYTREAFDERGNLAMKLDSCTLDDPYNKIHTNDNELLTRYDPKFVEFINDYTKYCKDRGATVYLTNMVYLDESVNFSEQAMINYNNQTREDFDAPLISDIRDYIFDRQYMGNTWVHCNAHGVILRTQMLYDDMIRYQQSHP